MLGNPTLPYNPDKFITEARQPELDRIDQAVRQSSGGERIEWPVVNFWGVTGIGKTWLLDHINHRYQAPSKKRTLVLLHKFEEIEEATILKTITRELANKLASQLSSRFKAKEKTQKALQEARDGNHHALIHALIDCVQEKLVPIILFDNTEKLSATTWEIVEKDLMEPLVLNGRILFVIAGRRYIPRWRRFEVRRRVQEPHKTHLTPFNKESVAQLLKNRNYAVDVDILLPLTAGNPRLVDELGGKLVKLSRGEYVNQALIRENSKTIVAILQHYEEDLLKNVPQDLREYFYSVIPLRAYRMEALRFMLNKVDKDEYQDWVDGDYLRILRDLDQTEIVWWNRDRRAYTTDYIARRIINQRQLLEDSDMFVKWHRNAFDLYIEWANEHRKTSEDFILEAWFHLANIWQVKPRDKKLKADFKKTLEIARELTTDRKLVISKQLQLEPQVKDTEKDTEYDKELYDLLPGDWREQAEVIWKENSKQ